MSYGPAEGRGGAGNAKELLARVKVKKASQRSVVEEMSTVNRNTAEQPQPVESPSPLAPAPEKSPVDSVIHDSAAAVASRESSLPPVVEQAVAAPEPYRPAAQAEPAYVPAPVESAAPAYAPAPVESAAPAPVAASKKVTKAPTKKTGFWQTEEQWRRTRSTYDSTRRWTKHKTLSDYAAAAMEMYDRHNEEKYNDGMPFDSDPFDIPRGRPMGS